MSQVKNYGNERAAQYDDESNFDKGNRSFQVSVLKRILAYTENTPPNTFLELGCGTGFFTGIILDQYPGIETVLIDGSMEMLEVAKSKYKENHISYVNELLQEIDWATIQQSDLIFSALTIHHLSDQEKNALYHKIYENLNEGGAFIYFDQFKAGTQAENLLLEYLACKDIQERLLEQYELDFVIDELTIDKIIQNDRHVKASENDQEALINSTINELKNIGFKMVTVVYQEFRFFSIVAYK